MTGNNSTLLGFPSSSSSISSHTHTTHTRLDRMKKGRTESTLELEHNTVAVERIFRAAELSCFGGD
jgi:hypothetical protein